MPWAPDEQGPARSHKKERTERETCSNNEPFSTEALCEIGKERHYTGRDETDESR